MHERDLTRGRAGSQVLLQPLVLRGPGRAIDLVGAVRVQRDEVPAGSVHAVPAAIGITRALAEVAEIAARIAGQVIVIADTRVGDVLEAPPRATVDLPILGRLPLVVL